MFIIKQSGPSIRRGVFVALAVLVSALSLAAPSQAQAAEYEFQPIRLVVHDTEDGWPDNRDEPRMYYGGQVWAGLVENRGSEGDRRWLAARFVVLSRDLGVPARSS